MLNEYEILKMIFFQEDQNLDNLLQNKDFLSKTLSNLQSEITKIQRAMSALPTSREKEALPPLKALKHLTANLSHSHPLNTQITKHPILKEFLIKDLFTYVSREIIKTRVYNDKEIVRVADSIFMNLVKWSSFLINLNDIFLVDLLNVIVNVNAEYYRTNGIESIHLFPFGEELEPSAGHKEFVDNLEIGAKIDFLNSVGNKKSWAVGEVLEKDWNSVKIRCLNDSHKCYITNKYFEILPLNKKKNDYFWRYDVKVGDKVDFFDFRRNWKSYEVTHVEEEENEYNETMTLVKILQLNCESDEKKNFKVNVLSPKLAKFEKYSKKNQDCDDHEDEIYLQSQTGRKYAIMRCESIYKGSSIYIVKYINIFGENGGFDYFLDVINKKINVPQNILEGLINFFKSSCKNLIKPFIEENGKTILEFLKNYLITNTKENLRNFEQKNISTLINAISTLVHRIYLKEEAKKITQILEIDLSILCLKSEFLDKQFFGAKLFSLLESKTKNQTSLLKKKDLAEILKKENIFENIIKGHHKLISKTNGIFRLLFSESIINEDQLEILWNQIIKTDIESRNALLTVLKDIIWDFSQKEVIFFINRMIKHSNEIENLELLDLLMSLKKVGWNKYNDESVIQKVNKVLWGIIQNEKLVKKELIKECLKNFIKFMEEFKSCRHYIEKIFYNIEVNKNVNRNLKILGKLVKCDYDTTKAVLNLIQEKKFLDKIIDNVVKLIGRKLEGENKENLKIIFNEEENKELKRCFKFINNMVKESLSEKLLDFSEIKKIWNIIFKANLNNDFIFKWLEDFFLENDNSDFFDQYLEFFNENIDKFFINDNKNKGFFDLLKMIFYRINIYNKNLVIKKIKLESGHFDYSSSTKTKNEYILDNSIKDFECFEKIWKLFLQTVNLELEENLIFFISKLYSKPLFLINTELNHYDSEKEDIFQKCKSMITSENKKKIRKGTKLLEMLIKREEIQGNRKLKSFHELKDLPKILITIQKCSNYSRERFSLSIKQNKTIYSIKKKISNSYNLQIEKVDLWLIKDEKKTQIGNIHNSSTLLQMEISNKNLFEVREQEIPEINQIAIINQDTSGFTEKAKLVFKEIFETYSENGKMKKKDLAKFTSKATDGMVCHEEDDRVLGVFNKYDKEKKDFLIYDEFITFYWDCASQDSTKLSTVKRNLESLGYGKNLKLRFTKENLGEEFFKGKLRLKLAQDDEFFDKILFYLKNKEFVNEDLISFLGFITPNFNYLKNINENPEKNLKNIDQNHYLWNYNMVLIDSFIFNSKSISKIFKFISFDYNEEKQKEFILKIYQNSFFEIILNKIENLKHENEKGFYNNFYPFIFLEKILKIAISFKENDYISDTTNFIAFRLKQRKKRKKQNMEKKKDEEKNENSEKNDYEPKIEKETKDKKEEILKVEGPKEEKDSKNTSKNEKEKILDEEKILIKIKNFIKPEKEKIINFTNQIDCEKINKLSILNLNNLVEKNLQEIKTEKKNILKSIIVVLLSSLMTKPENMAILLKNDNLLFKKTLFKGLTHKIIICQFYFKSFYGYLTANIGNLELKAIFLEIIIKSIQESENNEEVHVLVELASNLLSELGEIKEDNFLNKKFDFKNLFLNFVEKLKNHDSKEIDFNSKPDNTLVSILTFLEKLIDSNPLILKNYDFKEKRELINYLFKNCLFFIEKKTINLLKTKCKTGLTRSTTITLLEKLVKHDKKSIIYLMIKSYKPLISHFPLNSKNADEKNNQKRNTTNFIGIKNPGCVCYMNAMLQQFYCTPTFRYGILLADDKTEKIEFEMKNNEVIDDNVFHQLQKMFSFLDISERGDFSPLGFCSSYKDFTGQRTNLMVQQDAQEFLNVIFDKLEKSLKNTPYKGILDSVFSGKTANVFTCKNCGFVRSNEELFYNLSLAVKNLEGIEDSFEKFIKEEVISDYNCDNCKKKCDITKQCFLKKLPNVLIIHLQKISFDLEALRNVKYASKYKFKKTLNLKKYIVPETTKKNKKTNEEELNENEEKITEEIIRNQVEEEKTEKEDDSEYEYKLVGVVIHNGNAEFGHYTSLINVNRKDPNRKNINQDLWLEFDDSRISKYKMENFENDCFGSVNENAFSAASYMGIDLKTSKSAYILVYDKVKNSNIKFHFNENNLKEKDKIICNIENKEDFKFENMDLEIGYNNLKKYIPEKYEKIILKDNDNLILENQLHSLSFTNSFADIIYFSELPILSIDIANDFRPDCYDKTLCNTFLKVIPDYFFKIFTCSKKNFKINNLMNILETSLIVCDDKIGEFFENVIKNNMAYIIAVIINHNDLVVRSAFNNLLIITSTLYIRKYKINLIIDGTKKIKDYNNLDKLNNTFKQFLDFLLLNLPNHQNQKNTYKKLSDLFLVIRKITERNPIILNYLLQINMLNKFYDIYINIKKENTLISHEQSLTHILNLIGLLLKNLSITIKNSEEEKKKNMINYYNFYANINLVEKIIKEDYFFDMYQGMHQIINVICFENLDLSQKIILICLKEIQFNRDVNYIGYLEAISSLISINDKFQKTRIKMILGSAQLSDSIKMKNKKPVFFYGLQKELNLKNKKIYFPSTFGFEKSLLDILYNGKEINEVRTLLIIFYLLVFADLYPIILDYLINLPPINYLHCNLFNWIRDYVNYQLKVLPNSYNPPKAELFFIYFHKLPNCLNNFEKNIFKYLIEKKNWSEEKASNFKIFSSNEEEREMISVNKNYMIGKTIFSETLKNIILETDNYGEFSIRLDLIKVSLLEQKTTGLKNLYFKKECLSFESYINFDKISNELIDFMGTNLENDENEEENNFSLIPIGEDEEKNEILDTNEIEEKNKNDILQNKIIENNNLENDEDDKDKIFFNNKYILRICITNECYKNYFVKLKISSNIENPNFETGEWIRFVKFNKKMFLLKNLTKINIKEDFSHLKVEFAFYHTEKTEIKFYNENEMERKSFELVYCNWEDKE